MERQAYTAVQVMNRFDFINYQLQIILLFKEYRA